MAKIYLIRHAQASFLKANYDELSKHGQAQSAALGEYLVANEVRFDKVYSGTLERQKHTCEIVRQSYAKADHSFPESKVLPFLNEHQGPKALRNYIPQLLKEDPVIQKLFMEWQEDPNLKRRNNLLIFQYFMKGWVNGKYVLEDAEIEPWQRFKERVKTGWLDLVAGTQKGESIAVFSSGGTISAIFAEVLNIQKEETIAELNYSVRNTSITKLMLSKENLNVLSFNEVAHLPKEMISFV